MAFEKQFILKCLDSMEQILSNSTELAEAIKHFTEEKTTERHQRNAKITDTENWTDHERIHFNSAVFEAIARASSSFYKESDDRAREIHVANQVFLEKYVPSMTENTVRNNRIDSVKQNIARIKKEDFKFEMETRAENPYSFFTPVTAGLVVLTAVAATAALLSSKA
jgi:hypothetical protein